MDQEVGFGNFFQCRPECRYQIGWQVADKAYGVGQEHSSPIWQDYPARGRVKRGEEHLIRQNFRTGKRVEQRRLARRGVANKRGGRERQFPSCDSLLATLGTDFVQFVRQFRDTFPHLSTVKFQFGLTAAAPDANTALLSLKLGVKRTKPGQEVGQLRQFDLQLPFPRSGAMREDIENQLCPVDNARFKRLAQVPLLSRG